MLSRGDVPCWESTGGADVARLHRGMDVMSERGMTMAPMDEQSMGRDGPWRDGEAKGGDLPAVIRPRPLLLAGLEALVLHNGPFAHSLGRRPEQVDAIARVVFHH